MQQSATCLYSLFFLFFGFLHFQVYTSNHTCDNGTLDPGEECEHNLIGCVNCTIADGYVCNTYNDTFGYVNCFIVTIDTNTSDLLSQNSTITTLDTNIFVTDQTLLYFNLNSSAAGQNFEYVISVSSSTGVLGTNPIGLSVPRIFQLLNIDANLFTVSSRTTTGPNLFIKTYDIDTQFIREKFNGSNNISTERVIECFRAVILSTFIEFPLGTTPDTTFTVGIEVIPVGIIELLINTKSIPNAVAFVHVTFVGVDISRPSIILTSDQTLIYIESDNPQFLFLDSTANITDTDINFPIIQLKLTLYNPSNSIYELLAYIGTPTPNNLTIGTYIFNANFGSGTLIVSGIGTPEQYTSILQSIAYLNNVTEPEPRIRTINIQVMDSVDFGTTKMITIDVINTNDLPVILTNITDITFIEKSAAILIDANIIVNDNDSVIDQVIQTATVTLDTNVDASIEFLVIEPDTDVIDASGHEIVFRSNLPVSRIQELFRMVKFTHNSFNPLFFQRTATFAVIDTNGGNASAVFNIIVQSVNDPPVISLLAGSPTILTFIEDSPPLPIGNNITISDPDGIYLKSLSIILIGNKTDKERITFTGINPILCTELVNTEERILNCSGISIISNYTTLVSSIIYENTVNDRDFDLANISGIRFVNITGFDVNNSISDIFTLRINVTARNDPPQINLGNGFGLNWGFNFFEFNSVTLEPSTEEHIVLLPFVDIRDEENDQIASLKITLQIINGVPEDKEYFFFRRTSPQLYDNETFFTVSMTRNSFDIVGVTNAVNYVNLLETIFYINDEAEPIVYLNRRVIEFIIVDNRGASMVQYSHITTIPVNDNKPRIILTHRGISRRDLKWTEKSNEPLEEIVFKSLRKLQIQSVELLHPWFKNENVLISGDVIIFKFTEEINNTMSLNSKHISSLLTIDPPIYDQLHKIGYWDGNFSFILTFPKVDYLIRNQLPSLKTDNITITFYNVCYSSNNCVRFCSKKDEMKCVTGDVVLSASKSPTPPKPGFFLQTSYFRFGILTISAIIIILLLFLLFKFIFSSTEVLPKNVSLNTAKNKKQRRNRSSEKKKKAQSRENQFLSIKNTSCLHKVSTIADPSLINGSYKLSK